MSLAIPNSVEELQDKLKSVGYIAETGLATSIYLSLKLGKPLLLEGEVGVGKTQLAKALAQLFKLDLIRLQCYEGIDANQAISEWNFPKQLMKIRAFASDGNQEENFESLYTKDYLQKRPLLQAVEAGAKSVLLIDELDRADDEFEAFLLEFLSDFQVTIPELGTIEAKSRPIVIITSNRTRDLHDALKRRCLYNWIGFPKFDQELIIVQTVYPEVEKLLAEKVVNAVNNLRKMDLNKSPGVAETIDWAQSLTELEVTELNPETAGLTLGSVIKDRDDMELVKQNIERITN
jgi:MoxR-like ATPase